MDFSKPKRTERVIQFGEGGFLRGFFDWMLMKLNEKGLFSGSAVVVQPIENGMCDVLEEQNCVYNHMIRGVEGIEVSRIDVISRCVNPYSDFEAYLALAENPDFRFVVSNTTESGIVFSENDKLSDPVPHTFPAKLTRLLKRRFDLGLPGFIFLPCELIDANGSTLRDCILKYAKLWSLGDDFEKFIREDNVFTNTLVDRINTGYPKDEDNELKAEDKMLNTSEYFHLWVIETDFDLEGELPLKTCGLNVVITKDKLSMYRTRKVRILNGAHTSLVPYALLSGFDTVRSCVLDEKMRGHIERCVYGEIIPGLDLPNDELTEYADGVLKRFENPYIKHYLSSIALNSVSKFKVRVLPSLIEYINKFGKKPENLIFSLAKLIEFYRTDMTNDSSEVIGFMKSASVKDILSNSSLWDEDISFLAEDVEKYIGKADINI